MKNLLSAVPVALALASSAASAAPIMSWNMTDTTTYERTINFEGIMLPTDALITSQFPGVSISGNLRANGCGYDAYRAAYGMPGNYLNTFGPGCNLNSVADSFSLKFNRALSQLTFDAYTYDTGRNDVLALYKDGMLVSQGLLATIAYNGLSYQTGASIGPRLFSNRANDRAGILKIDGNGASFDEIRFSEVNASTDQSYIFFDNLRFNAATTAVPEPGSLALLSLGLFAVAACRRRAKRQ